MHRETLSAGGTGDGYEAEVKVVATWDQVETRVRVVEAFHDCAGTRGPVMDVKSIIRVIGFEVVDDKVDFLALWHFDGPGAVESGRVVVGIVDRLHLADTAFVSYFGASRISYVPYVKRHFAFAELWRNV